MKKLLLLAVALSVGLSAFAQVPSPGATILSTNTTSPKTNLMYILPLKISQIQILAGVNPVVVKLYDNNVAGNTNITSAYTGYTNYVTNVVLNYISPLTGVTNLITNSMIVGTTVSVAASTNILPFYTFLAQPSTLATYSVNIINSKGVVIENDTNATITVTGRIND